MPVVGRALLACLRSNSSLTKCDFDTHDSDKDTIDQIHEALQRNKRGDPPPEPHRSRVKAARG